MKLFKANLVIIIKFIKSNFTMNYSLQANQKVKLAH